MHSITKSILWGIVFLCLVCAAANAISFLMSLEQIYGARATLFMIAAAIFNHILKYLESYKIGSGRPSPDADNGEQGKQLQSDQEHSPGPNHP